LRIVHQFELIETDLDYIPGLKLAAFDGLMVHHCPVRAAEVLEENVILPFEIFAWHYIQLRVTSADGRLIDSYIAVVIPTYSDRPLFQWKDADDNIVYE
jgi:hypothetical protein